MRVIPDKPVRDAAKPLRSQVDRMLSMVETAQSETPADGSTSIVFRRGICRLEHSAASGVIAWSGPDETAPVVQPRRRGRPTPSNGTGDTPTYVSRFEGLPRETGADARMAAIRAVQLLHGGLHAPSGDDIPDRVEDIPGFQDAMIAIEAACAATGKGAFSMKVMGPGPEGPGEIHACLEAGSVLRFRPDVERRLLEAIEPIGILWFTSLGRAIHLSSPVVQTRTAAGAVEAMRAIARCALPDADLEIRESWADHAGDLTQAAAA